MARQVERLAAEQVRVRLAEVHDRIAAARPGPEDVEVLAATKYVPLELMGALADAGVRLVGENTAQALIAKQERWGERFTWDFIGHLQSRKTKDVLPRVRLVHSVESDSVVERIQSLADEPVRVLLEINVAGEESKYGVPPHDAERFIDRAGDKVVFAGLMTMPPYTEDPEAARPHFARLRELRDRLAARWEGRHDFRTLSMGTTQDYVVAVQEGATIVRLGSVLYA
jgi:pyridoxal phosphate enzyme (YggS family)